MRLGVEGLSSPRPLLDTMPLVYLTDPFAEQLCDAFDEVLAPIYATLDCLPAYLDPKTTPDDMLDWLAGWIGLTVNAQEDADRKRELIITGADLLPWRGTPRSVKEAVIAAFNRETEVIESGAATCSAEPDSEPAGQPVPGLTVRVFVDADDEVDRRSLDQLVNAVKPAHIPHKVEVVVRNQRGAATPAPAEPRREEPAREPPVSEAPPPAESLSDTAADPPTTKLRAQDEHRPRRPSDG